MRNKTKIALIFLIQIFCLAPFVFADDLSCPHSKESEGAKDYLEATDSEIKLLGKESFHANIALVEKALKERGVSLPENGFITSDLRKALIAFQESAGLAAKGEINQETLDKLGVKF